MCSRGGAPPDNSLPFLGSEIVPGMTPSILTPTLASSQQPAVDTRHAYFSNEDLRLPVNDTPRVAQLVAEQICESGLQSPLCWARNNTTSCWLLTAHQSLCSAISKCYVHPCNKPMK